MPTRLPALSSPSFALISVLALVSLAALTATAFLASARLERQATRPLGETARLEMACTSAKECASQTLNIMCEPKWHTIATYWRGTNTNDWTNELGYLLLGRPNSVANVRWTYFCGFNPSPHKKLDTNVFLVEGTNTNPGSYLTEIGSFMATMTNGFVTNPTSTDTNCTLIPLLGGRTSPPVGWTYIYQDKKIANSTNTTNVPVARFSYYMEDLSGLIDAERMGGTNRTTGTNASEISLTNLTTNWSLNSIINAGNYNQFINPTNRSKYFSPALLLYANTGISTNDLRYFAHGLLSWSNFPNTIPVGVPTNKDAGYSQGGQLKINLNSSANLNVGTISTAITANLPGFTNRAGGMSGNTYVSNIAANIVDYADTDESPTATGSTVGYDNYPLPVVFSDRIALNGANPLTNTNNLAAATITVTTYVQLWNCSTLTSPAVTYSLVNNFQDVLLRSNGSSFPSNQIFTNRLTNPLVVPALPPNAVVILAATNSTTVGPRAGIPGGLAVSNNTLTINHPNGNSYTNFADLFELSLGGKIISQHKGSYTRIGQKITNGSWDWEGTALLMSRTNNPNLAPIGDPRMLRFQSNPVAIPLAYRSSQSGSLRWGGYPYYEPQGGVWNGHPDNWPDGRTSTPAPASGTGQSGGAGGSLPVAVGTPITNLPGTAPAILTTNGKFLTITELGNVFDPIQWKPPNTFTANPRYYNCNIDSTWTNTGAQLYGGGTTLRIGRPEHSRFAFVKLKATDTYPVPNMGQSAVALLDIFSVSDSYDNGGKINLNTAPAPVLRALAGGVTLTNDSGMKPSSTLAVPKTMTEAFAQGVMRFRAVNPFLTPSQLAFIATDYGITNPITSHWTNTWPTNAVFGNTNPTIFLTNAPGNTLGTTASMGVTAWNDQASEEWFSKIYNLSTVQSWNYRTYVVAQLVNSNGLPTGPSMRKYSLMYIRYSSDFPAINASPFTSFESSY